MDSLIRNAPATYQPVRIQRKRTKGWKMPANTVYVGRPTKWGNPFVIHSDRGPNGDFYPTSPELAVASFRNLIAKQGEWCPIPVPRWPKGKIPATFTTLADVRAELRGKNLACFCPLNQACHADVLLELANAPERA